MTKKILIVFTTIALAIGSAASTYKLTLFQPSEVAGKTLKPGDYKISLDGDKVKISSGKETVEATAKVETADRKFPSTTVRYDAADGKNRVQQIQIGGTNTKLVFN